MRKNRQASPNRREFLASGAAAAIGCQFVPRHVLDAPGKPAPSDKLNIGCIGIGGQEGGVTRDLASLRHG